MCAALLHPQQATTEELRAALRRKFDKFGNVDAMPKATRDLVVLGMRELNERVPSAPVMTSSQPA